MSVRALGLLGDRQSVPELIHLVYHYNLDTRWWAQISLVRLTGQNFGKDWQAWGEWWNSQHWPTAVVRRSFAGGAIRPSQTGSLTASMKVTAAISKISPTGSRSSGVAQNREMQATDIAVVTSCLVPLYKGETVSHQRPVLLAPVVALSCPVAKTANQML